MHEGSRVIGPIGIEGPGHWGWIVTGRLHFSDPGPDHIRSEHTTINEHVPLLRMLQDLRDEGLVKLLP